jgi:hypothetical protein
MKYSSIKNLSSEHFKRKTGIHHTTFKKMVELVTASESIRKKAPGRPMKLSYEDQLLMMLEYLREYRTYFHVAHDYGVSEANCYKIIKRLEDTLIKSSEFHLPNRKRMLSDDTIEVVFVDAAESPIERPKKNKDNTTLERKRNTH